MTFLNLPEDVILDVLCICAVSSVISISQTNSYLHLLAFTPTLWMSLVENLRKRGFVDRLSASDIRAMSTESLVAVVRRLVAGPETWSSTRMQPQQLKSFSRILSTVFRPRRRRDAAPPPVQPCAQVVLHLPIRDGNLKILRGGKYVLFCDVDAQDVQVLKCWRVADDSLLGTYRSGLPSHHIRYFEAEVLHGGEHANIVLCVCEGILDPSLVEIISWDFATGMIKLLSRTEYTGCDFWNPKICSDIAAARVYDSAQNKIMYVIIDWHAQQYYEILPPGPNFRVELIPGYLILTWTSGMLQEIRVVAITSLPGSWTPVVERNAASPVQLSDIPPIASHTVKSAGEIVGPALIFGVHESPLQYGTYRMWICLPYFTPRPRLSGSFTNHELLCRFRLCLPTTSGNQFTCQQQSRVQRASNFRTSRISYSGHTKGPIWATHIPGHLIFPPTIHSAPIMLQIPEDSSADIAPYSGAVAYFTAQAFVLSYFE
ncbi:hypothetical protein C8R44DRAFT_824431 [Mycena epipterygia]|nr:hypothetical protein C8R44DRAFT_824431 [Mycena epipterygia]